MPPFRLPGSVPTSSLLGAGAGKRLALSQEADRRFPEPVGVGGIEGEFDREGHRNMTVYSATR